MHLDFDTGSADLWVFSNQLSSASSNGHTTYSPSSSKLKSGYTWNIGYGDGSGASGNVYADTVVVGPVTATSQAVEAATSVSSQFISDTDNDKSSLKSHLFTVDLKKGAPGSYDFGFIDSTKYKGSISYVPVNTANGFWQFTAGAWQIGNNQPVENNPIQTSIADTGTSLLYLPQAVVTAYYKKVSGSSFSNAQGGYIFPCSASLPYLKLKIGKTPFILVSPIPGQISIYPQTLKFITARNIPQLRSNFEHHVFRWTAGQYRHRFLHLRRCLP
jgi:aspergillopepsin I